MKNCKEMGFEEQTILCIVFSYLPYTFFFCLFVFSAAVERDFFFFLEEALISDYIMISVERVSKTVRIPRT